MWCRLVTTGHGEYGVGWYPWVAVSLVSVGIHGSWCVVSVGSHESQ